MLYSIWRHRERVTVTLLLVAPILIGIFKPELYTTSWDWLGEDNTRETNSSTLRNIVLIPLSLLAIYLTMKRIKVAQRQARAAERSLLAAREAVDQSHKALSYKSQNDEKDRLQSQYYNAAERISSDSVSSRISAIYELQHLAHQDLIEFHIKAMKVLCAFVRFPPVDGSIDARHKEDPCAWSLRPDVQAAMEVIGSRSEEQLELESRFGYVPDLRSAYLVRLELRDADLSGVDMRGGTLWGADLMRTRFSEAELQYTDFSSPWVVRGQERSEITSQEGNFVERGNRLFRSMTMMAGTNFSGARMLQANLSGVDLQGANVSNANLPEVNFSYATLYGVDFSDSELSGANLTGTSLPLAKMAGANLSRTNLSGVDLSGLFDKRSDGRYPPSGLTQAQLDQARADPGNPPLLDEESDLVWKGN